MECSEREQTLVAARPGPRRLSGSAKPGYAAGMTASIELIGGLAATITTLCWVPQALKVIHTRETKAISLVMYLMLAVGIALWLVYGLLIQSWPLIGANAVTIVPVLVILGMKLRFG